MSCRAIIKTGYTCNNGCIFCHGKSKARYPDLTFDEIKRKVLTAGALGVDMVILSGGEPTIRDDVLDIAKFINDNKMELGVITNGRMLSYKSFFEKLRMSNLRYVYVSLHGDEGVHNFLTNAKSFKQTLKGIENVSKSDSELIVNCVVIKQNLKLLCEFIDCVKVFRVDKVKFSFPEPLYYDQFRSIIPDIKNAAHFVKGAIYYGIENGLKMGIDGFPLCLISGYEHLLDNLKTNGIKYISESFEREFFPSDFGNTVKLTECRKCSKMDDCPGIYTKYLEFIQKIEMVPFN